MPRCGSGGFEKWGAGGEGHGFLAQPAGSGSAERPLIPVHRAPSGWRRSRSLPAPPPRGQVARHFPFLPWFSVPGIFVLASS